jgi:hypothetical protein
MKKAYIATATDITLLKYSYNVEPVDTVYSDFKAER